MAQAARRDGQPIIVLEDVHKWFGKLHVLRGITLAVRTGEVVTGGEFGLQLRATGEPLGAADYAQEFVREIYPLLRQYIPE